MQEDSWEFAHTLDALRVVSVRNDEPAKASRPFDRDRDGLVPSGGAGFVILESLEHARQRGATAYAEVIGFGANSDGFDITTPSSDGAVGCMHAALDDAGIDAAAVDYINAHATSTPVGDVNEAQAIAKVFGDHPFVSSTKSMTGHEIGTAGSNELVYTLLMMKGGFIAANTNIDEIDEQCRCINLVANEAIDVAIDVAMSNSFGFGGVNTCLVVRRLPELV